MSKRKCIECEKLIWKPAKRCKSCENKRRWRDKDLRIKYLKTVNGKRNPNYGNIGKKSKLFKGGRTITNKGYARIYAPKHPVTKNKSFMEHRAVIEAHLNNINLSQWSKYSDSGHFPNHYRFLKSSEIVHHINGIKDDNNINNLMLFPNTKSHQQFVHFGDNKFICKHCKKDQRHDCTSV